MSVDAPVNRHAGLLRCARAEVIPQIPLLAPRLAEEPDVIHDAVVAVLRERGLTPEAVGEANLNKVERHSIAGFLLGQLAEDALEGSGQTARFQAFSSEHSMSSRSQYLARYGFADNLRQTIDDSASRVEARYTHGPGPEHSWLPLATKRYQQLGGAALKAAGYTVIKGVFRHEFPNVPEEGQDLVAALRSPALAKIFTKYARFIHGLDLEQPERVVAAHDLSHLLTSLAGLHGVELMASRRRAGRFKGTAVKDESSGRYRLVLPTQLWRGRTKRYKRRHNLPNARLKCAMHIDTDGDGFTNLQNLIHATINAAAEHNLL